MTVLHCGSPLSMFKIKRQLKSFSAAHRLINGYQGKCTNLHGHNYGARVTLGCEALDEFGFVADFSEVKAICDQWVQQHWDHATLVLASDTPLLAFLEQEGAKHFVIDGYPNTTAEVLAQVLFREMAPEIALKTRARLLKVVIAETENCQASYRE